MQFRNALLCDLSSIENIYSHARAFMRSAGNPSQWGDSYPPRELIISDIINNDLYIGFSESGIECVFAFCPGDDPDYSRIDGAWLSDGPYCAVHRVAAAPNTRGVLRSVMDHCFSLCESIRIDTHRDNVPMQAALERYGFTKCGTVFLKDGGERIAYQMISPIHK